jgi:gluconokinase
MQAMNNNSLHLISIDIGTTHTKAILYKHGEGILDQELEQCNTYYPKPGWVEQDPEEIFDAVLKVTQRLVKKSLVQPRLIQALVFTGILQSLIPVDNHGYALSRASTWADTRSIAQNQQLKTRLDSEEVKKRTGCTLHPMYFLSRLAWLNNEMPSIRHRTIRFISIKEYVIYRLFGIYRVDHSIASGTGIWNMQARDWDSDLLAEIGLRTDQFSESIEPTSVLPTGLKREYASLLGLLEGTPGVIGAFDGAQSHLGSVGLSNDRMSLTVGTGAALRRQIPSPKVIPGSEAWCYYLAENKWLLGGVVHDAGNAIRWFADNLMELSPSIDHTFSMMSHLASNTPVGSEGLVFLPLFGGDRCPNYRPDAKGAILGLTFSHGRGHLVRALMEGLAYHLFTVYRMLTTDKEPEIVVTGGILKSPIWLKIVADLFGKTLYMPKVKEAAALGGVMLCLKGIGEIQRVGEVENLVDTDGIIEPDDNCQQIYQRVIADYDEFYKQIYG